MISEFFSRLKRVRSFDPDKPFLLTYDHVPEFMEWLESWYGRRSKVFIVKRKRCPLCTSYLISRRKSGRKLDENGNTIFYLGHEISCPFCQRLTVEDPRVPDNENPVMDVAPHVPGWVRCPNCRFYFSLDNDSSWSKGRHRTCGQRLQIVDP